MKFNNNSLHLTQAIAQHVKREQGIYFTPMTIVDEMCRKLEEIIKRKRLRIKSILEPSCGSCNFVKKLDLTFRNKTLYGIECNKCIYNYMKYYETLNNKFKIINKNFLNMRNSKFDVIIGNPPYGRSYMNKYSKYHNGQGNLYIYFILKSLKMLKPNGILCFLLPNSFLRVLNYNRVREHIYKNYNIIDIVEHNDKGFINTNITTISIFIQNKTNKHTKTNDNFTLKSVTPSSIIYTFNTRKNTERLKQIVADTTSLYKLKYSINIGNGSLIRGPYLLLKMRNFYNISLNYPLQFKLYLNNKQKQIDKSIVYIKHDNKDFLKFLKKSLENEKTNDFVSIYFKNQVFTLRELKHILPLHLKLQRNLLNGVRIEKWFNGKRYKGFVKYLKRDTLPYKYLINYENGNKETMDMIEVLNSM